MSSSDNKPYAAAIEGWHTMGAKPALIGTQCDECGNYFFPKQTHYCKNPQCESTAFTEVEMEERGTLFKS